MDPPHDPPQSTPLLPPSTTKSSLQLLLTLFAITTLTLGITLAASLSTQSLPPITSATVSQGTNDPASFSIILVTGEETDKFTGLVIKDVECEIMRATGGADDGTKQVRRPRDERRAVRAVNGASERWSTKWHALGPVDDYAGIQLLLFNTADSLFTRVCGAVFLSPPPPLFMRVCVPLLLRRRLLCSHMCVALFNSRFARTLA